MPLEHHHLGHDVPIQLHNLTLRDLGDERHPGLRQLDPRVTIEVNTESGVTVSRLIQTYERH